MIHRRDELRASKAMQHKVLNTSNIEMLWNSQVDEVLGDDKGVNGIRVVNVASQAKRDIPVHGLFVAIGHTPNTELFAGQVKMADNGYIETTPGTPITSVEGVFAAGDCQDHYYRQAVTAAGSGCMAAIEAERFLSSS